ncbi:hypothetical protein Pcar_1608 [Syntrophotalea carbinolica DSM 2380]|uniref:Uncharacterized protein n=1 Tax=Syntrophotalea carbinolica (strain DSM 2380 / NBRC 103641 / GraBd1) TaxID=338963 RepID=Q3A455_SYNC1|nr:hypothetical protein [Syntrophotalea carbinolica]ABA88852.1 hypothetical protein Pcar_1608 [Syntrophotalea carbinolica DSM 2380]
MIPSLSFLREQLTVEALDDDQVAVTVVLPAELVRSYCFFLDSLAGFFRTTDRHSTIARALARTKSSSINQEAEDLKAAYRDRLVKSYDKYVAGGLNHKEAIKHIVSDLQKISHPWRTREVVSSTLKAAGRSGYTYRSRRGN